MLSTFFIFKTQQQQQQQYYNLKYLIKKHQIMFINYTYILFIITINLSKHNSIKLLIICTTKSPFNLSQQNSQQFII